MLEENVSRTKPNILGESVLGTKPNMLEKMFPKKNQITLYNNHDNSSPS